MVERENRQLLLSSIQDNNHPELFALIEAARMNPKDFGLLYRLYVNQVYRYLYSRVGNIHDAEDLTAQTFLVAFESFHTLRQDKHFASWLFGIARHKAMDYFRKQKRVSDEVDLDVFAVESDPLADVIQSEQAATLSVLIRQLPEDQCELLRLRFLGSTSFADIAKLLNRKENTVKKAIYRILARLQNQLEDSHE